jgi:Flp pilus assembly protein TadG
MRRRTATLRRGALAVEAAFVYPVLFLLLFGLIIGGLAVFRYQQVACQAQEAARWASVRGSGYQKDTGQASPSQQDIVNNAVVPLAGGMNLQTLAVQVHWVDEVSSQVTAWDSAGKAPTSTTASGTTVTNRVRVTVTYPWTPPVAFLGPYNLTCTAEIPMSN